MDGKQLSIDDLVEEQKKQALDVVPPKMFDEVDDQRQVNTDGLTVSSVVDEICSFVLHCNGDEQVRGYLVKDISLKNTSGDDISGLRLEIRTDVELIDPFVEDIKFIPVDKEIEIRRPKLIIHGSYLASLTESAECLLFISITKDGNELFKESHKILMLPFDVWPGDKYFDPKLLAAFVVPNHPAIETVRHDAVGYLQKFTGMSAFTGYQGADIDSIKKNVIYMTAALYYAVQNKNIVYSTAPHSMIGQRVRLPDEILKTGFGTCMDLTLLLAGCLEQSGLRPLLIMFEDHIFLGVWLVDDKEAPDELSTDPSQLVKRLADGVNEILVIECTDVCSGVNKTFDDARKDAEGILSNRHEDFDLFVDVKRARTSRISPLPVRRYEDGKYAIESTIVDDSKEVIAPSVDVRSIEIDDDYSRTETLTKIDQWERRLLDFSMRNILINIRPKSSMIPLLVGDIAGFEDDISSEREYEIVSRPMEWDAHVITAFNFESLTDFGPYRKIVDDSLMRCRINSWWPEKELNKLITKLYRTSKSSMEENGANTLYLSLGLLKYYEGKSTNKPHYAPLVLVPIEFIRKSANKGFVIRKRDDDAIVNITLLEYLKQEYQMDISGLNPPPKDEAGVDIDKVLAIFRRSIMDRVGWDVLEVALVANFSFSQFVMWNDIHSRSELLSENKIVRSLIEGRVDWDTSVPEDIDEDDTFLPVPVDASQLHAVKMAANDISFVLHGPPGTGKSQTITAMIANAMCKGKTVLFVAEKRAALEVVQKRLSQLGIENFCLELHSNKAVKRNILDQLKKSVDIRAWGLSTDYESKITKIHQMRAELDDYVNKLHEKHACGMSIRELIDAYESLPDVDASYRIKGSSALSITADDLERNRERIARLKTYGSAVGKVNVNPLCFVKQSEYSHSTRKQLDELLCDYPKAIDSLEDEGGKFASNIDCKAPVSKKDWQDIYKFAEVLVGKKDNKDNDLKNNPYYLDNEILFKNKEMTRVLEYEREAFLGKYRESILKVDLNDIVRRYSEAQKKVFGKSKAIKEVKSELQMHCREYASIDSIPAIQIDIDRYKKVLDNYNEIKNSLKIDPDDAIEKYKDMASEFIGSYEAFIKIDSELDRLLKAVFYDDDNWLGVRREIIATIEKNESGLRDWINYQAVKKECTDAGLGDLCSIFEDGLDPSMLESLYYKAVYKALIWEYIEESESLNMFSGAVFDEKIRQYKKAEDDLIQLTKEEIYYRLTHNLPTPHESVDISRELTLIRKAISSGGRGLSIRSLFDQIPHILTRLCPCLLMSPMSVAQYLPVDSDLFDIVVFDEASQVPTSQAVGALARGKNGIIVGDPNQLPPTSFFSSNVVDEEHIELEDLDSILDDCLALGMPETHLEWHYRSRHESLIAFSNKEYYDDKMLTFPSVNDRERRVKLCTVNGIYCKEKDHKNHREGEAVVREVLRRFNDADLKNRSIGIVTFNIRQRELIEDLLDEEYKKNSEFDIWAHSGPEELFVKNLENVQGDERDVILFSVGFGPDEHGKISYNFGPLNKDGGWKRLNVAVSRARMEMIIFSSMTPDMINTNKTNAKGVIGLKDFLSYAQNGVIANKFYEEDYRNRGITNKLCAAIENAGYVIQKDVGSSNMKIDIAVINPYDKDEYLLGILLDGDSYRVASTTKDREISQISVLKGLGWNLYRVWTMDWWEDSNKEIQKVLDVLKKLKLDAAVDLKSPKKKDTGPESEEIVYSKPDVKPKERTKKDKEDGNLSFDTYERFRNNYNG